MRSDIGEFDHASIGGPSDGRSHCPTNVVSGVDQNGCHRVDDRGLERSPVLSKIHSMRAELTALWGRSMDSHEQLVHKLQDWCQRAEASGIAPLAAFSQRLRSYG